MIPYRQSPKSFLIVGSRSSPTERPSDRPSSGPDRCSAGASSVRLRSASACAARFFALAPERGVHLGSLTRGLIDLLDTHGTAALQAALAAALAEGAAHLAAVRHFIDLQRAQRGACPPVTVTLPDDPRVRALTVRPHKLTDYEQLARESLDERSDDPCDADGVERGNGSNDGNDEPITRLA
jgi:hypothetical protein